MKSYIYLIHPMRQEFFEAPTRFEEQVMGAHEEYLRQAAAEGRVSLAGYCLDETFELVVISAESDDAARRFMLDDPAVKNNIMMAELHPMKISQVKGC
jgi:uncharacterized protein YciI